MNISGSRALLESLIKEGVDTIFGYPGGAVIPIYNMLNEFPEIRHILVRHEQGAGHMAEGYALATGKVGVCLVTSGPGATNLVTPIANAMLDSAPIVAITGQVSTEVIGTNAFQEVDFNSITISITKRSWLIEDVNDLPDVVAEAFALARSGRPGPTVVVIPRDVAEANFDYIARVHFQKTASKPTLKIDSDDIQKAVDLIKQSKRPVLYAGGGVILSGASQELFKLAERGHIPVTTTLKGLGSFPEMHPLSLGMLGMHGTAYANYAVDECDLLIAVGARFDDRVTGKVEAFVPLAKIIHIDIDPNEMGKVIKPDIPLVGDVKNILIELLNSLPPLKNLIWNAHIAKLKHNFPLHYPHDGILHGQQVIEEIGNISNHDAIVVTDVGQHQMWAAQFYKALRPRQFITSGGLGTMGFGLPAAIGAQFGEPGKKVFCITGDGSIQMCIQELIVATIYKLPIIICILNNSYLGMVRQWQDLFHESKYSQVDLEASPDFMKLAEAYGAYGIQCNQSSEVRSALDRAFTITDRPILIDFRIAKEENVFPMIPSGGTIDQMVLYPKIQS